MSDVPQTPPIELADDAVVLDVREQDEWDLGHAPNAVHIPLGDLAARLGELPQVDGPLPVMCKGGGRSARAVAWLTQQGFEATNVDGGMTAWAAAGKQMVATGDAAPRVK
ncbi:rhodanese-like domain-containing protein [Lapillicoccus sp.]|uniref:rhodanese-like domain-containing protein n=1 Tax=Lapillicoccus sp. TaxID=1909287 RepID=UPI0025E9D062|nr:rhodanese-like domain-containing protein [Lapillicoccus sp.]